MAVVNGSVAKGFEKVRDAVAALERPWGRGGGTVAAYVGGELVVDLWGGDKKPGTPWEQDTIQGIASVTKSWAAVVVGRLVEQGVLAYDAPLVTWWPEFGQHGKERVTLADVFFHSSGVLSFDGEVAFLDRDGYQGWHDLDGIGERLAAAKPAWTPGTRNGYHAVSFGWLLNVVVHRATGKTIGELFAADVAEPLGLDLHLGTPAADFPRLASAVAADLTAGGFLQRLLLKRGAAAMAKPDSLSGRALLGDGRTSILERAAVYGASPVWMASEVPASNGSANSRALAKLFMALAAGGELDGVRVLDAATIRTMSRDRGAVTDTVMTEALPGFLRGLAPKAHLSYGLMPNPLVKGKRALGPNPDTFASMGFGGQLVLGDPGAKLSFASTFSDFTPGLDRALQPAAIAALYASLS